MELGLLAASVGTTVLLQRQVDQKMRSSSRPGCGPLLDMMHERFPDLSKYERGIDLVPAVLGAIVLYLALRGRVRYQKVLLVLALVFFARAIMFSSTLLPSPLKSCPVKGSQSIGGCHDCIFSGHTATTLVLAYFIQKTYPSSRCVLLAYCVFASMFIVTTRAHYTIDVIVAWIVVYAIMKTVDESPE